MVIAVAVVVAAAAAANDAAAVGETHLSGRSSGTCDVLVLLFVALLVIALHPVLVAIVVILAVLVLVGTGVVHAGAGTTRSASPGEKVKNEPGNADTNGDAHACGQTGCGKHNAPGAGAGARPGTDARGLCVSVVRAPEATGAAAECVRLGVRPSIRRTDTTRGLLRTLLFILWCGRRRDGAQGGARVDGSRHRQHSFARIERPHKR
jgi:hypothetical protein